MDIQHALKGISLTMTATGSAAMLCTWFICIAVVGIWGGAQAKDALNDLYFAGLLVFPALIGSGAFRNVS